MSTVIKVGGNVIDNEQVLSQFLTDFAQLTHPKVLVHGGGKIATELGEKLAIETKMVDGRRITDDENLKLVTMVYAGLINKKLVARIQAHGCNAVGLTGADGNCLPAHKRQHLDIDFGWVGDMVQEEINASFFKHLQNGGYTPVVCALTHDGNGHLLNTNADTIAATTAISLAAKKLAYVFDKQGVMLDLADDDSLVKQINSNTYVKLKQEGVIHSGMLPKLDNAFETLKNGVGEVVLCHPSNLLAVLAGKSDTCTRITL